MSLRLLVVEDDPASREFARSTLAAFAAVDTAGTLAEAEARCAGTAYDLLLLDVALPDGEGDVWLARRRGSGHGTPAVALTAELDPERRQRLLAAGFAEALPKPLSESRLLAALAPWVGDHASPWDDAQALAALGGSAATLSRMRRLFLDELPLQRQRVQEALDGKDTAALRSVLHQMRAGCGFVGASALAADVDALHGTPDATALAEALLRRIDLTLDAPPA